MPLYESVLIARPDISAAQVEALTGELKKIIEENGGSLVKEEYWGLKSLAYRIKKNRKGHYSLLNIDAPAAALSEMERNLRLNEDILRYMSIRVEQHEEGPSVMMQNKSNREDRQRSSENRDPTETYEKPPKNHGADDETKEETAESIAPEDKEGTGDATPSDKENKELDT